MTSDAVIQATTASIKQIPNVGYPDAKVGVVALIGENPLNVLESFNTTDAAVLTKWAKQHPSVQVLSFVDANSDTNSEFAKKFVQFEN